MDPDLPFYYWTANERYRNVENDLPSFNDDADNDHNENVDPQNHPLRLHRLSLNRRGFIYICTRKIFSGSQTPFSKECRLPNYDKIVINRNLFYP